jgi:hypothetical protein
MTGLMVVAAFGMLISDPDAIMYIFSSRKKL